MVAKLTGLRLMGFERGDTAADDDLPGDCSETLFFLGDQRDRLGSALLKISPKLFSFLVIVSIKPGLGALGEGETGWSRETGWSGRKTG